MMRESFSSLTDERKQAFVRHDMFDIIAMTIAAVIGNCDGWDEIEDFCNGKAEWLKKHMGLTLEHGIPSADTLARIWGKIKPEEFRKCFTLWVNGIHERTSGEIVSIDGKTLCGSREQNQKPIHMISAWASQQQLVLGQRSVEEKSNEIPAVPLLLAMLDISGCIVTADAMSCQRETARKVIDGQGDYVFSLKENQPALYEYAKVYFDDALKNRQSYPEMTSKTTTDKGHGRLETRTYYLTTDLSGIESLSDWPGLTAVGMVKSRVMKGDTETEDIRYAITSLSDVAQFSSAMRTHWSIENSLHYSLDISFNEDHSRIRTDHAPENMAVIRHFAISALKQLATPKNASIKRKRKLCAYDSDLLASAIVLILL